MSRGLGIWQKFVLDQVNSIEDHQVLPLVHLFDDTASRSDREAIRRAVRTLKARGEIYAGEDFIDMEIQGRMVRRIGVVLTKRAENLRARPPVSLREHGRRAGVSHTTVARLLQKMEESPSDSVT